MLRDVARDFARTRLVPYAAERDREERFPAEELAELGKLGFMGMLVPETYGGAGADHVGYALVMEEIAAGEGAVSTILSVQNSVGCMPVLQYGSAEQKQRFLKPMARGEMLSCFCLTEPQAGSDAADWPTIVPVLGEVFGAIRPAATALICGLVDPRMKIEIEVTARRPGAGNR